MRNNQQVTEGRNFNTLNIDSVETREMVRMINNEDKKVAYAVEEVLDEIAEAIKAITESLEIGGRLIYVGSGTSGKLGVIDASECPPTFGVDDSLVQAVLSGGEEAFRGWLEHTEDDQELAVEDMKEKEVTAQDAVVGISASGNTPYVFQAVEHANQLGATTVGVLCNSAGNLIEKVDISICVEVGPEVIMGSTRMKAGTAQKMVLNMLSTGTMIKLGKVYSNLMINVQPINKKLKQRVEKIVRLATEADIDKVKEVVVKTGYDAQLAIVMLKKDLDIAEAKQFLEEEGGDLRQSSFS